MMCFSMRRGWIVHCLIVLSMNCLISNVLGVDTNTPTLGSWSSVKPSTTGPPDLDSHRNSRPQQSGVATARAGTGMGPTAARRGLTGCAGDGNGSRSVNSECTTDGDGGGGQSSLIVTDVTAAAYGSIDPSPSTTVDVITTIDISDAKVANVTLSMHDFTDLAPSTTVDAISTADISDTRLANVTVSMHQSIDLAASVMTVIPAALQTTGVTNSTKPLQITGVTNSTKPLQTTGVTNSTKPLQTTGVTNSTKPLQNTVNLKPSSYAVTTGVSTSGLGDVTDAGIMTSATSMEGNAEVNTSRATDKGWKYEPGLTTEGPKDVKSALYRQINESIPIFTQPFEFQHRTCQNRCGQSEICSCKPICQALKTCCIDFVEACGHRYDLRLQTYSWLQSLDTVCIDHCIVVSSCSRLRHQSLNINPSWNPEEQGNISDIYFEHYSRLLNITEDSSLIDIVLFLLFKSQKVNTPLLDFEEMLISGPILDESTGISYRNISMYICNGASVRHAKMWLQRIANSEPALILTSKISLGANLFDLANLTEEDVADVRYRKSFEGNVEWCTSTTMHDSCPPGYADDDVKAACESVAFPITTFKWDEQTALSTDRVQYKNLFCLQCNIKSSSELASSNIRVYADKRVNARYSLEIGFGNIAQTQNFTVYQFTNFYPNHIASTWDILACRFSPFAQSGTRQVRSTLSTVEHSAEQANISRAFALTCDVTRCRYGDLSEGSCMYRWTPLLALPPSRHALSDAFLQSLLVTWKRFLLNSLPGVTMASNDTNTFFIRYQEPQLTSGLLYGYVFYASVFVEVTNAGGIVQYLRPSLVDLLRRSEFPFQNGKEYACFTIPWTIPGRYYCSDEHMVYVNTSGSVGDDWLNTAPTVEVRMELVSLTIWMSAVATLFGQWMNVCL